MRTTDEVMQPVLTGDAIRWGAVSRGQISGVGDTLRDTNGIHQASWAPVDASRLLADSVACERLAAPQKQESAEPPPPRLRGNAETVRFTRTDGCSLGCSFTAAHLGDTLERWDAHGVGMLPENGEDWERQRRPAESRP